MQSIGIVGNQELEALAREVTSKLEAALEQI